MHKKPLLPDNQWRVKDGRIHSEDNSEWKEDSLCLLIAGLTAREKKVLKTLGITTIEDFCEYDFKQLHGIRGYGELTVYHIRKLQSKLCAMDRYVLPRHIPITLNTPVKNLRLSPKEIKALLLLGVVTAEDFLKADLSQVYSLKSYGERTHNALIQSRKRILAKLPDAPNYNELALANISVTTLGLNTRESAALRKNQISSLEEFAWFDLRQMGIPSIGAGTLQSLVSKQWDVRLKMNNQMLCMTSTFSCDDKGSVFQLDLTQDAKETLWQLGIIRISELVNTNFRILEHASSLISEVFHELQTAKSDLENAETADIFNDFFSSCSLQQLGMQESQIEILYQNNVDTIQDFLFFTVPGEHIALRQIQSDWRGWYTPKEFLLKIPTYFNICFYQQRNHVQDVAVKSYLESFTSVTHFFSTPYEDIVKLTEGDLSAARHIQSLQYETVKSCLKFHEKLDFPFIRDEREPYWMNEITEDTLLTLPFFSGKPNRGFAASSFHESFLPHTELHKITKARLLLQPLDRNGMTLGKLLLTPHSHLSLLDHFTKSSIHTIQMRIRKLLLLPPPPLLDKSTPDSLLISLLKSCVKEERKIEVFLNYIHEQTYVKVGKKFNVSHERVRQIVKACKQSTALALARPPFTEAASMLEFSMIKLGGFAHIRQITGQFADDNVWNRQDCTQAFVAFLLGRVSNKFEYHGQGYYSTLSFPCLSCQRLNETVSGMTLDTSDKPVTWQTFFSTLKSTCCSDCIQLPRQVPKSFLEWYMLGDHPEIVVTNDEIYLSDRKMV